MSESYLAWGLALLAAALLLIVVEVFVPSAGMISLMAAAMAIAGVVCLFQVSVVWGVLGLLGILILGPVVGFFALNIMPSTPLGKKLLFGSGGEEEPGLGSSGAKDGDAASEDLGLLIGSEGVALTDLRPVGTIRVGETKVDALAETSMIRAGTKVRITAVVDNQIKVRPVG